MGEFGKGKLLKLGCSKIALPVSNGTGGPRGRDADPVVRLLLLRRVVHIDVREGHLPGDRLVLLLRPVGRDPPDDGADRVKRAPGERVLARGRLGAGRGPSAAACQGGLGGGGGAAGVGVHGDGGVRIDHGKTLHLQNDQVFKDDI